MPDTFCKGYVRANLFYYYREHTCQGFFFILCFLFPPTLSPAFLLTQANMSHLPKKAKYFQDFYSVEEREWQLPSSL